MALATRLAAFDAGLVLSLWAVVTVAAGSWHPQVAAVYPVAVAIGATALVFWRVRVAYANGAVTLPRAFAEGAACGAALALLFQVVHLAVTWQSAYASGSQLATAKVAIVLAVECAIGVASGGSLAAALWSVNAFALRRHAL